MGDYNEKAQLSELCCLLLLIRVLEFAEHPLHNTYMGQHKSQRDKITTINRTELTATRHRASTSMYSLTFCICVMLPECHQWKPTVQAAAVMLRTPPPPPSTASHQQASHAHFPYTARNFENAPVTRQLLASSARRPRPAGRSHYAVTLWDGCKLVTRVRVMLP